MKLYVVLAPDYDFCDVVGVFSNKKISEDLSNRIHNGRMIELELDSNIDKYKEGLLPFGVWRPVHGNWNHWVAHFAFESINLEFNKLKNEHGYYGCLVWAEDKKDAIEKAEELFKKTI